MRNVRSPRRPKRTATLAAAALLAAPLALANPALATAEVASIASTSNSSGGSYVLLSAPPKVSASATALFAFAARNTGSARIGSLQLAIPAGFTPRLPLGFGVTSRGLWTLTLKTCTASSPAPCAGAGSRVVEADARRSDGKDKLGIGEALAFAFVATAPSAGGTYPWVSGAATSSGFTSSPITPVGPTPSVTVISSAATDLRLTGLPSGAVVAGTSSSATVTALDAFGNVATGYRGTVHFMVDHGGAQLPGDYTFTAADAGKHTFSGLVLTSAPAQSVTVTDSAHGLASAPTTVTVTPAAAASLSLELPGSTPAGVVLLGTVTAHDAYANVATGYTGTIHFSVTNGSAAEPLPADYTFTAADQGSHSISVTLTRAGARTLTVDDGSRHSSATVTVSTAPASKLTLTPDVATTTAGVPFGATVAVTDHFDNPITSYAGTVHLSADAGGATLPADYTFLPSDAGSHHFGGLLLTQAVSTRLTAADTAVPSLSGEAVVDITAGAATHLTIDGNASVSATAGDSVPIQLTARDAYGNLDPTYSAAVTFSCVGVGSLGACAAPDSFNGGHASASSVLTIAGADSVAATSGALPPATQHVTVGHAAGAALSLTSPPPTTVPAGTPFGLTISVVDGYGNLVGDYPATVVTLTADQPGAPFPATATTVGGVATFAGLTVTRPGGYALTAAAPLLSDTGAMVTVVPGAPARIVVDQILDQGTAPRLNHPVVGQPFDTSVSFFDSVGNPAAFATDTTIRLGLTTGTGTLGGSLTATATAGATSATIVGSTYSVLENAVTLSVSAAGAAPAPASGSITTDVAGQAVTAQATPGVALPPLKSIDPVTGAPCVLSSTEATCSEFQLKHGASSTDPVYLYQTVCENAAGQGAITCKSNGDLESQLVYATATLKDANGRQLYFRSEPATLIVRCYVTVCPHPDGNPVNYSNNLSELREDVAANPLSVSVVVSGTLTVTGDATICKQAGNVDAGKYFCLDPKSGRDGNGNYVQYLLFFGDPLAHNR